jgi:hypothetical protein
MGVVGKKRPTSGAWDCEKMALFMGKILFSTKEKSGIVRRDSPFQGPYILFLTEGKLEH